MFEVTRISNEAGSMFMSWDPDNEEYQVELFDFCAGFTVSVDALDELAELIRIGRAGLGKSINV